ncbi:MAG TPA: DinB family protein [Bryobacteraceae bacterium]|nr:DinB family protein [Bryobacteraceae bacterium]
MPINQMLLTEFDQEMANTRKVLERYPEGKADWRPHEKSMTLGRLSGHVVELPGWTVPTLRQDSLTIDMSQYQPLIGQSAQQLLEVFDKNVKEARAAMEQTSDEAFMKPWSLILGGKPLFTMPRIAVMRNMVLNHLIHHRAQLGVYLRLNNIAIPGMYGPSADEDQSAFTGKA